MHTRFSKAKGQIITAVKVRLNGNWATFPFGDFLNLQK